MISESSFVAPQNGHGSRSGTIFVVSRNWSSVRGVSVGVICLFIFFVVATAHVPSGTLVTEI
jgi:hypothetical protein